MTASDYVFGLRRDWFEKRVRIPEAETDFQRELFEQIEWSERALAAKQWERIQGRE